MRPIPASVTSECESYKVLGNSAKSVDKVADKAVERDVFRQERRKERFRLQRIAQKLMPATRLARCMCRSTTGGSGVRVVENDGVCSYRGLETCGSVWLCPVCSRRISEGRRAELNQLLAWARAQGYLPAMLTLTMRHGQGDRLSAVLDILKAAKKAFHQSRTWRAFKKCIVGHVTATEVTHGLHGWHPHFHVILILTPDAINLIGRLSDDFRDAWLAALTTCGGSGNGHALSLQGADQAGDYVTKWGAASEMVLSQVKRARYGMSRNPWQILSDCEMGEADSVSLWSEYADVFKGRRQLVWSRGLKALAGIGEVDDDELAELEVAGREDDVQVVAIDPQTWAMVVRLGLQAELLTVCERRSSILDVATWLNHIRIIMRW